MSLLNQYPRLTIAAALLFLLVGGYRIVQQQKRSTHHDAIVAYYEDMLLEVQLVSTDLPKGAEVVIFADASALKLGVKKDFRGVYKSLEHNGLSVLHVEAMRFDAAAGWRERAKGFPYSEFLRIVQEYPDADAVMSLLGLPYDEDAAAQTQRNGIPPFLVTQVLDEKRPELKRLLENGAVQAGVIRLMAPHTGESEKGLNPEYELLRTP